MASCIHVLLTPPGQVTSEQNLGVLQLNCMQPWVEATLLEMANAGWVISIVPNPMVLFPDDSPYRVRAREYIGRKWN